MKRHALIPIVLVATPALAALSSGCASYETQPIPDTDADTLLNRYEKDGFVLSASLPENDAEVEKYLDRDVRDWDVLPLLTFLQNRSDALNFEVRVRDATFRLADGTEFERIDAETLYDEVRFSGWRSTPWWFLLIFPGAISLAGIAEENRLMKEDYETKALTDRNLPPGGEAVQGFLFFRPVGKSLDELELDEGILAIEVTQRGAEGGEAFTAEVRP